MTHFAKLDENNIVTFVTVGRQEDDGLEAELTARTGDVYKQTSYNTLGGVHYDPETGEPSDDQSKAFRYNYAGIGFTFDPDKGTDGAFIPPQPFNLWTLDDGTCLWVPPTPQPGLDYTWNDVMEDWIKRPQPHPSWVWDETETKWVAPVPYPDDGERYTWDEDAGDWVAVPNDV